MSVLLTDKELAEYLEKVVAMDDKELRTNPVAAFVDGLIPQHACVLFGTVGAGEGPLVILPKHEDWRWVDGWWLGVFAA